MSTTTTMAAPSIHNPRLAAAPGIVLALGAADPKIEAGPRPGTPGLNEADGFSSLCVRAMTKLHDCLLTPAVRMKVCLGFGDHPFFACEERQGRPAVAPYGAGAKGADAPAGV